MRRIIAALTAATATLGLAATCAASSSAATPPGTAYPPLCGTLPVYHATGKVSMATWAKAHHAFISTIVLSTMDDCTHSGNPVVLKLVRMMDHYVNLGNQHLNMPRGLIFTSPPQAQHAHAAPVSAENICLRMRHAASGTVSMVTWTRHHHQPIANALILSYDCGNGGTLSRPGVWTYPMVRYLDGRKSVNAAMPKGLIFWSALIGS